MQRLLKNTSSVRERRSLVIKPDRKVTDLSEDIRTELLSVPRSLSPKYFYDERGSRLFDQICNTPEYYPTRVEDQLLKANAENIISTTLPDLVIELGSGSSRKTRRLFDASESLNHQYDYAPFDVCEPMLDLAAEELDVRYEWLDVKPLIGDYHAGLANLPGDRGTRLFVFLGSTIGNFSREELTDFIEDLHNSMSAGDYFLVGADRVKDIEILNAAYNDAEGLTAEFNLNVLRVLNRESGSNFNPGKFQHLACFVEATSQIEMYLVSLEKQEIIFEDLDCSMKLEKGERILTEISRKFEYEEIESCFSSSQFEIVEHYQPTNEYFSLLLVRAI